MSTPDQNNAGIKNNKESSRTNNPTPPSAPLPAAQQANAQFKSDEAVPASTQSVQSNKLTVPGAAPSPDQGASATFAVVLTAVGPKKIDVIKLIRQLTNLGLADTLDMVERVESTTSTIFKAVSKDAADDAKRRFEEIGATVRITTNTVREGPIVTPSLQPPASPQPVDLQQAKREALERAMKPVGTHFKIWLAVSVGLILLDLLGSTGSKSHGPALSWSLAISSIWLFVIMLHWSSARNSVWSQFATNQQRQQRRTTTRNAALAVGIGAALLGAYAISKSSKTSGRTTTTYRPPSGSGGGPKPGTSSSARTASSSPQSVTRSASPVSYNSAQNAQARQAELDRQRIADIQAAQAQQQAQAQAEQRRMEEASRRNEAEAAERWKGTVWGSRDD